MASVQVKSEKKTGSTEWVKGSLDCTDWDVFADSASDINELTESVCGYAEFCVQHAIPHTHTHTQTNVPQQQTLDN